MASSAASSEHFEKLHEIFRGLHEDLQGVPERLLGTAGTAGRDGGGATLCTPVFPKPHDV
ncbi:vesicle transport through interaction with t-SNAREs 1B [Homo sapiens]|uniref:Vesicle transport through interaction with t-SNAREs 1B n=5 Tax=Hominoidea TaxID=314295 RepID=G3V5I2_HUMAN|nr:vesicle transport through interaction with t-SNAREs 1B [Homo sapiens]KAI4061338.1 vesicle transport through interaction with t-SNAREs 1B [Homo sapiens]